MMHESPDNPTTNALGAGINEDDLLKAVGKSGYPLQTVIANYLRATFNVEDEWSYTDKDTSELRTIDIYASKQLFEDKDVQDLHVRPWLDLLIECKQSSLPYVFFLSPSKPDLPEFPLIAGLARDLMLVTTDDIDGPIGIQLVLSLGLDTHRFIKFPEFCYTLSKSVRKGQDLELSGSESYNGLVLPILKSLQHFKETRQPPSTARYFDARLTLGIAVIDAPMVGVRISDAGNELVLLPWARVIRNESTENVHWLLRSPYFAIDIVHKDFFRKYICEYVMEMATDFAKMAVKHEQVLAMGRAFVSGIRQQGVENIESRLTVDKQPTALLNLKNIVHLLKTRISKQSSFRGW